MSYKRAWQLIGTTETRCFPCIRWWTAQRALRVVAGQSLTDAGARPGACNRAFEDDVTTAGHAP